MTAQRKATASALGAHAAAHASADSDISSDTDTEAADEDEAQDPTKDAARHASMLADVRGSTGDRKRKRPVVMSEAYPDSEYNLPPTSSTGEHRPRLSW